MFDEKFFLALSFLIFAGIFYKLAVPILKKMIDSATKNIAENIEDSKKLKEDASRLISDAYKRHEEALVKSEKIIQEAKIESENMLKVAQERIEVEINKKIELADKRIKDEQEKINHLLDKLIKFVQKRQRENGKSFVSRTRIEVQK